MDGFYGWPLWMAALDGHYKWLLWMAIMDGLYGWPLWMTLMEKVSMHNPYRFAGGWLLWMAFRERFLCMTLIDLGGSGKSPC